MSFEPQPESSSVGYADDRPRVFIVDDDEDQVNVLSSRLEKQGFHTHFCLQGQNAVRRIKHETPHVIIMDLRLPDADGLDLCGQLSDDPQTAGIPIIVVSGAELPNAVRQARAAGGSYYVRKPYDPNALLLLIRHSIDEVLE